MRLVQFRDREGRRGLALGETNAYRRLDEIESVYELALEALEANQSLALTAERYAGTQTFDLGACLAEARILPPLEHPVPTRCWVTTSGPGAGGAASGWAFRGNGSTLVGAKQPLPLPDFAPAGIVVPVLFGCYLIADDGTPCRLGWTLGQGVLGLDVEPGHAHLRTTAVGPELLLGPLPGVLALTANVNRGGQTLFDESLPTATNSEIDEAAARHFRYETHRRPGDVHLHGYATGTSRKRAEANDEVSLAAPAFGRPLSNPVRVTASTPATLRLL